jgi:hypothetical protein
MSFARACVVVLVATIYMVAAARTNGKSPTRLLLSHAGNSNVPHFPRPECLLKSSTLSVLAVTLLTAVRLPHIPVNHHANHLIQSMMFLASLLASLSVTLVSLLETKN